MIMECDKCHQPCDGLHSDGRSKLWICDHCRMLKNPATGYILVEPDDIYYSGFTSLKTGQFDPIVSIQQLIRCGWLVREIIHKVNNKKQMLKLEYHGRLRCLRISPAYRGMPFMAKECRNHRCGQGGIIA